MAKLGWRIIKEEDKMWVRMLKARYWEGRSFMNASAKSHHSPLWKDIVQGREILEKGLRRRIGNGKDTSLWYHWWVGEGPLIGSLITEIPESISHWLVGDIIREGRWTTNKISRYVRPQLVQQIQAIPLTTIAEVDDDFIWHYDKKGKFNVKSAYYVATSLGTSDEKGGLWNKLWKMKVPFKYRLLLWNAGHKILPSASFLASRIPNFDPTCPQCERHPESLLHMIRDCHVAKGVWGKILHYHQPKNVSVFFSLGWDDWIHFNCSQNEFWQVKFYTAF